MFPIYINISQLNTVKKTTGDRQTGFLFELYINVVKEFCYNS